MNKDLRKIIIIVVLVLFGWWLLTYSKDDSNSDDDYNFNITEEVNNNTITESTTIYTVKDQFPNVEELHWDHMPLIYKFSDEDICRDIRKDKVIYAFNEISNSSNGTVSFKEGQNYDILVSCSNILKDEEKLVDDYWITTLGEGGIDNLDGNRIISATVKFYPVSNSCGYYPFVEIHEILHSFGYDHGGDSDCSIMSQHTNCKYVYNNPNVCGKTYINEEYSSCLKYIYSNGKYGECSNVKFLESEDICEKGLYPTIYGKYCCPEPDMIVNEEGYCDYP